MKEPKIYSGLRQFRRTLDQAVAVLNYLLDNGDFHQERMRTPEEIEGCVNLWEEINFIVGNRLASDEPPRGNPMKSEIYNALAAINRGADLQLDSLAILQTEGKLPPDYVEYQRQIIEETRSGINSRIHDVLGANEDEDWHRFEQLRLGTEARLRG
jgi:hypothetical protein